MCLIIAKPSGVRLPTFKVLKKAFDTNSDGFGLAYRFPNSPVVFIRKGAMSYRKTKQLLHLLPDLQSLEMLLHFRQATAGEVTQANCHPFPLSSRDEDLSALEIETTMAIAHNGVISEYSKYGTTPPTNGFSDTQMFIKEYLTELGKSALVSKAVLRKLIGKSTYSRFAFLSASGFKFIGTFEEHDGCQFGGLFSQWRYNSFQSKGWDDYGDWQDYSSYRYTQPQSYTINGVTMWRTYDNQLVNCDLCGKPINWYTWLEGCRLCIICRNQFKEKPVVYSPHFECYD